MGLLAVFYYVLEEYAHVSLRFQAAYLDAILLGIWDP